MLTFGLQELRTSEKKMLHKLELDREKNSVKYLAQAKVDCEGIASFTFYLLPLVTAQIQRARSDHNFA
jgi:hypothetical protein